MNYHHHCYFLIFSVCRREISVLKRMRGRANVIEFIDAAVKETRPGVHQVFILTKFYVGGPILNLMNARLHLGKSLNALVLGDPRF